MAYYLLSKDDEETGKDEPKIEDAVPPTPSTSSNTPDFRPRTSTGLGSSAPGGRRKTYAAVTAPKQGAQSESQDDSFDRMTNKEFPGLDKTPRGMPSGSFYGSAGVGRSTRSQTEKMYDKCPTCNHYKVSYAHITTCQGEKHSCWVCRNEFPSAADLESHFVGCFEENTEKKK